MNLLSRTLHPAAALLLLLSACAHAPAPAPAELPFMEAPASPPPAFDRVNRADGLLRKGGAAEALALYREAWEAGNRVALTAYNAGCAAAKLGAAEDALAWLERAVEAGFRDARWMREDEDLAPLRGLPAFAALVERLAALPQPERAPVHPELARLEAEDQADRSPPPASPEAWKPVVERDRQRRERVAELLAQGAARTGEDFFAAALVFQHGKSPADFARARELAAEAARRGHPGGLWLAAAAWDRWLMNAGRPQRFGTQYKTEPAGGPPRLYPVDPKVGDDERARWGFPPLAEIPTQLGGR